jgi:uncharacterized membrane protein HdeD (DUF308 family)
MIEKVTQHWMVFLVRGILVLFFGIAVLAWPGHALFALVMLFGLYALADGMVTIAFSFAEDTVNRGVLAIEGVLGILVGLIALRSPGMTAAVLYIWIAVWAIVVGIAQLAYTSRLRRTGVSDRSATVTGALQVLFGILLLAMPRAATMAVLWLIAIYAFVQGIVEIGLALQLRQREREVPTTTGGPAVQH